MEKLGLSVEEAAETIGIGRSEMYEQIAAGNIQTFKVGRRRLVRDRRLLRSRGHH